MVGRINVKADNILEVGDGEKVTRSGGVGDDDKVTPVLEGSATAIRQLLAPYLRFEKLLTRGSACLNPLPTESVAAATRKRLVSCGRKVFWSTP
jgi:hypothetical protein